MTSINVLRLDDHSGLFVCDEARYWNPEWMIFYTPEKIRSVVRRDIQMEQKIVMFMGQTGTSSIGDEWIAEIHRELGREYDVIKKKTGGIPSHFMSLEQIAHFAFKVISNIKHAHTNDYIKGKFGFSQNELIAGQYQGSSGKIEIKDKDIQKQAAKYLTFDSAPDDMKGVFGNSQILGGYSPTEGFRMFYMTERWPVCEEIQEIFLAQGSGRDTCDLYYSRFADTRSLTQRKAKVPILRAEGLAILLEGLNAAFNLTAGVGGYPKIIYVNAQSDDPENWVTEICDHRSKLASEMVAATTAGFVDRKVMIELLEDLIFLNVSFDVIHQRFFSSATHKIDLFRFLRNYPVV